MAHRSKQNQTVQRQVNDYEKIRLLRIEENQKKLRDLGVKSIANYLTSLVESQKIKKKIVKPSNADKTDADYISDLSVDDVEGVDMEIDTLNDDGNERDKSQDDVDQDDEYEDMDDMTFVDNENEIQMDNRDDDLGNEDNVIIQQQLQGISQSKKRGPTMLHVVHTRKVDDREVIICNEFGQPVGPVTNEKDVVERFSRFLGTIARNHSYAPLIHSSWHKVPHKDKIWDYVLEKYDVPDAARKWVLMTIGHSYKVHKCRFNKQHFYQFKDDKTRWKNRPKSIPEGDFAQLLRLWNNTNVKKRFLRAKEIRMSQKNMHTAGPKSFARIRDEMKNDDPNKDFPTLTKMFEQTRKRTEGRVYVDTYDDTKRKIEQMKTYKASENESASMDLFRIVMNKENGGYCRLYGRGQKHELLEMRKELDEEHERKKT
ncbi:hypothetical protein E3N88_37429 [Mikania micrantha]|uniref:Uncharacterized protein n=1 Tax=Mikania micrantha TaxID=192012 RepID=A0A5N6LTD6_9ASTR|nr:hypothetical protein E3N88_37429 [Mikania micrantha]